MAPHVALGVVLRLCIPFAVVPAVGRPEQSLGRGTPIRFVADHREQNDCSVGGDGRTFGVSPKTAQNLYAAGNLPSGAVHARLVFYELRNFDVTAKVARMTWMEVF